MVLCSIYICKSKELIWTRGCFNNTKFHGHGNNYMGELLGILCGTLVAHNSPTHLYTDSSSSVISLTSLQHYVHNRKILRSTCRPIILGLLKLLKDRDQPFFLQHIYSHSSVGNTIGFRGNDMADRLANLAVDQDQVSLPKLELFEPFFLLHIDEKLVIGDYRKTLLQHFLKIQHNTWGQSPNQGQFSRMSNIKSMNNILKYASNNRFQPWFIDTLCRNFPTDRSFKNTHLERFPYAVIHPKTFGLTIFIVPVCTIFSVNLIHPNENTQNLIDSTLSKII